MGFIVTLAVSPIAVLALSPIGANSAPRTAASLLMSPPPMPPKKSKIDWPVSFKAPRTEPPMPAPEFKPLAITAPAVPKLAWL